MILLQVIALVLVGLYGLARLMGYVEQEPEAEPDGKDAASRGDTRNVRAVSRNSSSQSSKSDSSVSNLSSSNASNASSQPERAYENWTSEEEEKLVVWKAKGISTKEIARRLKRSKGAVRSRFEQAKASFWTPSRTRKLARSAGEQADVEEVAENLELPKPLVQDRMQDLGFVGDGELANLRDRLNEGVVKVRFWKFQNKGLGDGTPSDCDAAWLPSKQFGSSEKDFYLFSESEASTFARVLVTCYGFDGEVTRSSSGRTWNVWNTPRDRFKRKAKQNRGKSSRRDRSSSRRRQGSRKVSADQMARYERKHPEVKNMDHPEHWVQLSEQLMVDPMTLKSNLD